MKLLIISAGLGALASGVALLLFSLVMWFLQLSTEVSDTFALLIFGAGCLVAGIAAGGLRGRMGLVGGIKAALLLMAALAVITIFTGGLDGEFVLGRLAAAVLCGGTGGVIGVNRR